MSALKGGRESVIRVETGVESCGVLKAGNVSAVHFLCKIIGMKLKNV